MLATYHLLRIPKALERGEERAVYTSSVTNIPSLGMQLSRAIQAIMLDVSIVKECGQALFSSWHLPRLLYPDDMSRP